jgi:hypothetical protein
VYAFMPQYDPDEGVSGIYRNAKPESISVVQLAIDYSSQERIRVSQHQRWTVEFTNHPFLTYGERHGS